MSEMTSRPVDNGERLSVSCALFRGVAGVRRTTTGGEFAFFGDRTFLRDRGGTVDGQAVRIVGIRKSDVATGMIVAEFAIDERA